MALSRSASQTDNGTPKSRWYNSFKFHPHGRIEINSQWKNVRALDWKEINDISRQYFCNNFDHLGLFPRRFLAGYTDDKRSGAEVSSRIEKRLDESVSRETCSLVQYLCGGSEVQTLRAYTWSCSSKVSQVWEKVRESVQQRQFVSPLYYLFNVVEQLAGSGNADELQRRVAMYTSKLFRDAGHWQMRIEKVRVNPFTSLAVGQKLGGGRRPCKSHCRTRRVKRPRDNA